MPFQILEFLILFFYYIIIFYIINRTKRNQNISQSESKIFSTLFFYEENIFILHINFQRHFLKNSSELISTPRQLKQNRKYHISNIRIFSYILLISNFYKVITKNLECMNTFLIYLQMIYLLFDRVCHSSNMMIWLYLTLHILILFYSMPIIFANHVTAKHCHLWRWQG